MALAWWDSFANYVQDTYGDLVEALIPFTTFPFWVYVIFGNLMMLCLLSFVWAYKQKFPISDITLPVVDVVLDYSNTYTYIKHHQFVFVGVLVTCLSCGIFFESFVIHQRTSDRLGLPGYALKACGFGVLVAAYEDWTYGKEYGKIPRTIMSKLGEAGFEGPLPTLVAMYSVLIAGFLQGYPDLGPGSLCLKYGSALVSFANCANAASSYADNRPKDAECGRITDFKTKAMVMYGSELAFHLSCLAIFALVMRPYGVFVYSFCGWLFFAVCTYYLTAEFLAETPGKHIVASAVVGVAFFFGANPSQFEPGADMYVRREASYEPLTNHWGWLRLSEFCIMTACCAVRFWLDHEWYEDASAQLLRAECLLRDHQWLSGTGFYAFAYWARLSIC
eukprot:TRINITY_DN28719_c0_g1_i1.p1 TRINITY_DN28719_c0_g1~~TRINITY_DN28719_c0_g1_i1.p1  ORF type:complete len:434 (+),score=17.19 TRINITY_DN28719_c0_g1_i1:130-1302(+)